MIRRCFILYKFRRTAGGFTLLEMCIVLVIIALLATLAMPAMDSAFAEQSLRGDEHRLALLVKTGMIKAREEGRPWRLSLAGRALSLQPVSDVALGDAADQDGADTETLGNVIQFADATKENAWEALPEAAWTFRGDELCPLPRVRLERGSAYVEASFNALTGDVEDEADYLP